MEQATCARCHETFKPVAPGNYCCPSCREKPLLTSQRTSQEQALFLLTAHGGFTVEQVETVDPNDYV